MSLSDICTNALREIGGIEVPALFYGSGNATARQCVALVQRGGNDLERANRFSSLIKTYTFTTVADVSQYDLPSDFRAFANMSQWDRAYRRPLRGPSSAARWQFMKSGIFNAGTIERWFRIEGSYFVIHPTPTISGQTLAFDYYSKNWITRQADSSDVRSFTSDLDTCKIDEDLLTLDLKWRFLQAKGFPFEAEYKNWEAALEEMRADDGGKGKIQLGPHRVVLTGIPETGFGGN